MDISDLDLHESTDAMFLLGCAQSIADKHDRGEEILAIAMTKMEISKAEHERSANVTEEYGGDVPPVGTAPRMLQLTIPQRARTNFNSKDSRL